MECVQNYKIQILQTMWLKLAVCVVTLLVSVAAATNYFETFFVEPEPAMVMEAEVPSRNALRFGNFKWPRAEVPFVFDESSYGKIKELFNFTYN